MTGYKRLPVGQTDSFDGVVAVVDFVAGFKHNAEPPAAKALHRLKVSQIPGGGKKRDSLDVIIQKKNPYSIALSGGKGAGCIIRNMPDNLKEEGSYSSLWSKRLIKR